LRNREIRVEKPTAGPWKVEARRGDRVTIISAGVNAQGDGPECDVINAPFGMSEVNAALICAAPNMLEVLQTTAGNIRSMRAANPSTTFDAWLAVVEDAITRATSEAP
jgi:hypothetical protein